MGLLNQTQIGYNLIVKAGETYLTGEEVIDDGVIYGGAKRPRAVCVPLESLCSILTAV